MKNHKLLSVTFLITFFGFISSCNTTGTNTQPGKQDVKLQFKTTSPSSTLKTGSPGYGVAAQDSLVIEGTNGTLKIDDIRFIVSEFKLEPIESDEEEDSLDTESEEFEVGPFWVDLPLGLDTLVLGKSTIEPGVYKELEFEIEDLDLDDEDEGEKDGGETQSHLALADSIRSVFPDWPDEASMLLTGTFTPTNGTPQSFKVYAEAEIEIEREFLSPLEITADNQQDVLSVQFNPTMWLKQSDGSVMVLSEHDWDQHQHLLEFEVEFEKGVEDIEADEDSDGDDENEGDDD